MHLKEGRVFLKEEAIKAREIHKRYNTCGVKVYSTAQCSE